MTRCIFKLTSTFLFAMGMIAVVIGLPKPGRVQEQIPRQSMVFVSMIMERGPFMDSAFIFKRNLEQDFVGDIDVSLMIDGQVGTEETMMATLRRGRTQGAMLTVPGTATAIPEMALFMAPYLFESFEEADFVLDTFATGAVRTLFAARGVHFIQWYDSGWHIVFARSPIRSPADLIDVRMRAAGGEAARFFLEATGADVVPLPFNDLVPGLETGLVDGGSTNVAMYRAVGLYELAPHMALTYHAMNPGVIMANKQWFDSLSPDNQRIVEESFLPAPKLRRIVRDGDVAHLEYVRTQGIKPYALSVEERELWQRLSAPLHGKLIDTLGGDSQLLYDQIRSGKEAYARQRTFNQ